MGVTIHYSGQLKNPARLEDVIVLAENLARESNWAFSRIESVDAGHAAGFVAFPHRDCEPLRFEFGDDFRVRSWVKTQFAGLEVHVDVVSFLKQIRRLIGRLGVRDEGEYWETGSKEKLREHMDTINGVIREMKEEKPSIRVAVREPDGRIIDVIG